MIDADSYRAMARPRLRCHVALSVWLVVGHRIQSGFREPGEAAALLEAAKERARRDQDADRAALGRIKLIDVSILSGSYKMV